MPPVEVIRVRAAGRGSMTGSSASPEQDISHSPNVIMTMVFHTPPIISSTILGIPHVMLNIPFVYKHEPFTALLRVHEFFFVYARIERRILPVVMIDFTDIFCTESDETPVIR